MSTRGAVAIGTPEKWAGYYNHFDSYPEGLGMDVWEWLKSHPVGEFARFLEAHPGGWSSFPEKCYCHDPYFAERDGSAAKDSPYYREDVPSGRITSDNPDPLSIEFVYIVEAERNLLHVLEHYRTDETRRAEGRYGSYDEPVYRHRLISSISLSDLFPNWNVPVEEEEELDGRDAA